MTSGVPQGFVLGPTLFLIYINDLGDNIRATVRLFVDDTILYRPVRNQSDVDELQEELKRLETLENTWQMEFNVSKCHVLSVTNKKKPITPKYDLYGHTLEQVHNAEYLGMELDEKMKWTTHVNAISSKANRTSAFIYRNLKGCPTDIQAHCYKTLARPLLEYSSPVWDPHQQKLVNTLEMAQ